MFKGGRTPLKSGWTFYRGGGRANDMLAIGPDGSTMHEFEIKYQVPPERRAALEAALQHRAVTQRVHLQAAYFDTPGRDLARAGMALRLRKEGRRWVQTLKAGGGDALTRFEHNVALGAGQPQVDPQRHAGTPQGDRLLALVQSGGGLVETYRTDVWRRLRRLKHRLGTVEMALDVGEIRSGERRLPLCEFEVELVEGRPQAVLAVAGRWMQRFGLWLDIRSKAERGDRLAQGVGSVPATKAAAVELEGGIGVGNAWQRVLAAALAHLLPNVCELADERVDERVDGRPGDAAQRAAHRVEQVHQARVALRRLRTALRFFRGWPGVPQADEAQARIREVFARLGQARDRDVVEALLNPVWQAQGLPPPAWGTDPAHGDADPALALRSRSAQELWLLLLGWQIEAASPQEEDPDFAEDARKRLKAWHRAVARHAKDFLSMDDPARHALRKRIKRLRYAVDYTGSLFGRRAVKRYLQALALAQECFGTFNDLAMAEAMLQGQEEAAAWFARGWLSARRDAALGECQAALDLLARAPRFWKKARRG
jgi:triphosphatase